MYGCVWKGVGMLSPVAALSLLFGVIVLAIILAYSVRIVKEYERAVVFRLGRVVGAKGPGLIVIVPFVDRVRMVDLRIHVIDVPKQRVITKDNVEVSVDAVVYYRVFDPLKAVLTVRDYQYAVAMLAQTTLRDVLGQVELDDLLTKREELNKKVQRILDELTDPWGIKVTAVTIKEVVLPENLVRAMAKQAEAERWRRAKVIEAEGERQAAKIMVEAAQLYREHPIALRLRELQTLVEVAKEKTLMVVYPMALGAELPLVAGLARMEELGKRARLGEE